MKYLALLLLLVSTAASADIFRPWAPDERRTDYIGAAADTKPTANVKRGAKAVEYDTNKTYRWTGREDQGASTDWKELYEGVTLGTTTAGERNEDSTTGTDYTSTSAECWPVTVNTADNSTTVYNGPAVLEYVYVNTALSAATVLLVDGATTKITLPASMAAGSSPRIPGTMFRTSLVVDPDDASTGNITVCFRPLDADSTWTP